MDGPSNPHDILAVLGEKELQGYLVNEIQEVYRLQGVNINDKHIEVIVRQMMRWVKIEDVGDTEFLVDDQVDRFRFMEENERVIATRGSRAKGRPLLLGITKASLSTDSFISAASFQETTRVLTEASISGKVGFPARPEGERHDGPPDPGGHRLRVLPGRADPGGRAARRRRRRPRKSSISNAKWSISSKPTNPSAAIGTKSSSKWRRTRTQARLFTWALVEGHRASKNRAGQALIGDVRDEAVAEGLSSWRRWPLSADRAGRGKKEAGMPGAAAGVDVGEAIADIGDAGRKIEPPGRPGRGGSAPGLGLRLA